MWLLKYHKQSSNYLFKADKVFQKSKKLRFDTCDSKQVCTDTLPPQFSKENRLLKLWDTNGDILARSWVRTLVAKSDWCASLNVVSINSRPLLSRTALANPSGPFSRKISFQPLGCWGAERGTDRLDFCLHCIHMLSCTVTFSSAIYICSLFNTNTSSKLFGYAFQIDWIYTSGYDTGFDIGGS